MAVISAPHAFERDIAYATIVDNNILFTDTASSLSKTCNVTVIRVVPPNI
jgi:hypothetical protein